MYSRPAPEQRITNMDTTPITTAEVKSLTAAIGYPIRDGADYNERRAAYRAEVEALEARWAKWLGKQHGGHLTNEARWSVFEAAKLDSGSQGYEAIESNYRWIATSDSFFAKS